MAYDAFLKVEDVNGDLIEGDVVVEGHKGEMEIASFSFGIDNPTTIGSATGGAGSGKVNFHDIHITKRTDKTSPVFFKTCCAGAHFQKVTLTMRKAGTQQNDFLKYELTTVFVSSMETAGAEGGDDSPLEDIGLMFAKFHITFTSDDGSTADAGWDVANNTSA